MGLCGQIEALLPLPHLAWSESCSLSQKKFVQMGQSSVKWIFGTDLIGFRCLYVWAARMLYLFDYGCEFFSLFLANWWLWMQKNYLYFIYNFLYKLRNFSLEERDFDLMTGTLKSNCHQHSWVCVRVIQLNLPHQKWLYQFVPIIVIGLIGLSDWNVIKYWSPIGSEKITRRQKRLRKSSPIKLTQYREWKWKQWGKLTINPFIDWLMNWKTKNEK